MIETSIINYIKYPEKIRNAEIGQLKEMVKNYPFFQATHIILLKYLKDNNQIEDFELQLSKSSIHISDRDLLFKFLNTDYSNEDKNEKIEGLEVNEKLIKEDKNELEETLIQGEDLVEKSELENAQIEKEKIFLKNKDIKRKINNSFEGMGENISETISSQLQFAVLKDKDKLEYPSEIYFIDEERSGKNNVITIDADPDEIKKLKRKKDILQIDETIKKESARLVGDVKEEKGDDIFELIETEEVGKKKEKEENRMDYFDINHYADESALKDKYDLISQFIEKNPRIETKETQEKQEDVRDISKKSIEEDVNLLSETLIKVYIKQGLFEKAIESYRKLSLKYPEKNTYFASQIKILEDKINK